MVVFSMSTTGSPDITEMCHPLGLVAADTIFSSRRIRWQTGGSQGMSNEDLIILKVLSVLNEAQARLYVAKEAICMGYGGVQRMHALTRLSRSTILKGMSELRQQKQGDPAEGKRQLSGRRESLERSIPTSTAPRARQQYSAKQHRVRRPGGGRKLIEEVDPDIKPTLERLLADEIAGDPMTEQKWIRNSLQVLSKKLAEGGHRASSNTVARLLKDMGFSLKANRRKQGRIGCPERDEQFKYIASQKQRFIAAGWPVISIDTKKKELIGEFRNNGRTWRRHAEEVNEHDFPGAAKWRAVPFGIYDVAKNEGYVYVGISSDTPEFAVRAIARWWQDEGCRVYPIG